MRSSEPVEPAHSSPRPDDLLEHATFLRRLAARLVGPDEAADVVQEAYAKVLAAPPRPLEAPRGWLATVVANLARNRRRARARRELHERAAARPEGHEPADESARALERLELQRVLAELVVSLPEEQRTVLFLRYFEGQSPSAIARRLGAPLKTIESRHTRALAQLRQELDTRAGGDREAWAGVLIPWALAARGGRTFASELALLAVALAGTFLVWRSRESKAVPRESLTLAAPQAANEVSESTTPTRESMAPAQVVERFTPGRLAGVVLAEEDRRPLAGLALRLLCGDGTVELVTDADGRFHFETEAARRLVAIELRAGPVTVPQSRALGVRLEPGEVQELELLARSGGTLTGLVVDQDGIPVAGATVSGACTSNIPPGRTPERQVTSGPDGSFVIEHLGEDFVLFATAPGLACYEGLHGKLASGARGDGLVLHLAPAVTFRGEVVDPEGRPIEGAWINGSNASTNYTGDGTHVLGVHKVRMSAVDGESDAQGRFEVGPSAEGRMNLSVSKTGFVERRGTYRASEWNRIVLERGLTLAGSVSERDGRPVADARVILGAGAQGRATTDAEGEFRITALEAAEGSYLLVSSVGHALDVLQPVAVGEHALRIELQLESERILAGRVLDESGRPFADAELRIEGDREVHYDNVSFGERTTWEWAAGLNKTRTDGEGRFRFEQLYDGAFDLFVLPCEGPPVAMPFRVRSGEEALELVVTQAQRHGVVFTGRVLDALSGAPIQAFDITLFRPTGEPETRRNEAGDGITVETHVYRSWTGKSTRVESKNGEYRLSGNVPGPLYLSVQAAGFIETKLPEVEPAPGEYREEVRLMPARQVQFVLVADTQGDASIQFFDLAGESVRVGTGGGQWGEYLDIRQHRPVAATLPRTPLRVVASRYGHSDLEFLLEAERDGEEPVEVRFPIETRRSIVLQVYESRDASLTTGDIDLELLSEAFLDGVVSEPREPVLLEFHGPEDKLHCRAQLTPLENGQFKHVVSYLRAGGGGWSEGEGDASVRLALPESVRRVTIASAGCRTLVLDLALPGPWPERPEFRVVVLERLE